MRLASRKASDLQCVRLKCSNGWDAWIRDMFNYASQHGMSHDWTTNWIKPLHKGEDGDIIKNYQTIMVGSLMEKLFGCIMKLKISEWVEINGKRA